MLSRHERQNFHDTFNKFLQRYSTDFATMASFVLPASRIWPHNLHYSFALESMCSNLCNSKRIWLFRIYKIKKCRTIFILQKASCFSIHSNYWFIALIFVSIGVLFMDRSLQDAFTSASLCKIYNTDDGAA